jgi:phosphate acetyltransferase
MSLLNTLLANAKQLNKRIVLPEATEERTLKAADIILKEKIAIPILIGNPDVIHILAAELQLTAIKEAIIIDPKNHKNKQTYIDLLYQLRKEKGLTLEQAEKLVEDPLYLATLIIKNGDADGEVAGAINSTGNVLRPALQIIKTKKGYNTVSSCFLMILPTPAYGDNGVFIYSDCGVVPNPNAQQLAEIAISAAESAVKLANMTPKVAMLSFSTYGSGKDPIVDKVIEATKIARTLKPDLLIDGELQADAAIVPSVAKLKAPESPLGGQANVLVFPDLNAGNIAYKLTQRLANAVALGPILQGLAAPVNDLSRGCSVEDIVNLVAITANQAK